MERVARRAVSIRHRGHREGHADRGVVIVDYFLLLKVDGEWKVANKVYGRKPG
jgi:hypothetical protein